ncbi:MAG: BON domain-containing protein [Sandaracinaceae bacterium]|nr:BON domain-containing protein [Sandaracinaceae bacterium]
MRWVIALVLGAAACGEPSAGGRAPPPEAYVAPVAEEEALARDVEEALRGVAGLSTRAVVVEVDGRIVRLRGWVDSFGDAALAESTARAVPGVTHVYAHELRVRS